MGVFQTSEARTSCLTLLSEFRGISPDQSYVVRAFTTGRVSRPLLSAKGHTPSLLTTPSAKGYEIYTAYELTRFESRPWGEVSVASLGLVDKMTGGAAMEASRIGMDTKISVTAKLKALGVFGACEKALGTKKQTCY